MCPLEVDTTPSTCYTPIATPVPTPQLNPEKDGSGSTTSWSPTFGLKMYSGGMRRTIRGVLIYCVISGFVDSNYLFSLLGDGLLSGGNLHNSHFSFGLSFLSA